MPARVHWIDVPLKGRLAIMARPRAGDWLEDEISAWRADNIDAVVSLLEADEVRELELDDESELCRQSGIDFISFPIPDRGVPASFSSTVELARRLTETMRAGRSVAIHCRSGIGRSALIAACVLVCAGVDGGMAFEMIGAARGLNVPDTDEQARWLDRFRDALKASR